MSLLVINTLPVETAQATIDKLTAHNADSVVINTEQLNIHPCVGCNACWLKTPGKCSIKDDYEEILKDYLKYDKVIFLSGTALNFVDHKMKNMIDRLLPLVTMYTHVVNGQCRHVPRYHKKYKFGLLYDGRADKVYLNEWMDRVMLNFGGTSLGVFPIEQAEVFSCI